MRGVTKHVYLRLGTEKKKAALVLLVPVILLPHSSELGASE